MFEFFAPRRKVVIAMIHLGAMPGTPLYDADGGVAKLIEGAARDAEALQAGGVDAVMFGNENDRPYVTSAPIEGVAVMTAIVQAIKPMMKLPFGVNYLWDPCASIAIAAATGAAVRPGDIHRRVCLRHGHLGALFDLPARLIRAANAPRSPFSRRPPPTSPTPTIASTLPRAAQNFR